MKVVYNLNDSGGAIGVRWCLDQADLATIERLGLVDLTIVIDVFYSPRGGPTCDRIVVDASEVMRFVTFRRPGVARVCAALIGYRSTLSQKQRYEKRRSLHCTRDNDRYALEVFDFERDYTSDDFGWSGYKTERARDILRIESGATVVSLDTVDVEVPESYFAKPWPEAIDWWVTWIPHTLLRRKLWDECDRRRWLIVSILVQPFFFAGYYVLYVVIALAVFLLYWLLAAWVTVWRGYRGLSLNSLPLLPSSLIELEWADMPTEHAKNAGWSSWYLHDKAGNWLPWYRHWLQPAGLCLLLGPLTIFLETNSFAEGFIGGSMTIAGITGMWRSFRYWWNGYDYRTGEEAAKIAQEARQKATELRERERIEEEALQVAATLTGPVETTTLGSELATVQAIPFARRSVRLRLAELKAKVCRPMAQ